MACMKSIVEQSLPDFEAIVVDDGSNDGTADIAREFSTRDPRVRVVSNEANLGLVGNWNRCLGLARGEWIKFVFQDDTISSTCLADLLDVGERTGCPLVFGRRDFLFEGDVATETRRKYLEGAARIERLFPSSAFTSAKDFGQLALAQSDQNFIGEPVAVLFRRELTHRVGNFNPRLAVFCDMEYWMRAGVNTGIAHAAQKVASFRVHEASTTSRSARDHHYRMFVLDHVVVSHEFAFHPAYAPLRREAASQGIDLRKRFEEKVTWARGRAARAADEVDGKDRSLLQDLEALEAAYPRIRRLAWRQRRARSVGRLVESVSRLFRK